MMMCINIRGNPLKVNPQYVEKLCECVYTILFSQRIKKKKENIRAIRV